MPTALDTCMRAAATEIVAEFGATVTLHPRTGSVNPLTGDIELDDTQGVSVIASPPAPVEEHYIKTLETVKGTDKMFWFDAQSIETSGVVPTVGGSVVHNGLRHAIIAAKAFWSGEQIAAYLAVVRG